MSDTRNGPIALVLAGGGARGAYEAGVLSVLAPELDRRGQQPDLIVGTSIGALNTAVLAARAHQSFTQATAALVNIWQQFHILDMLRPVRSPRAIARAGRYTLLAGVPLRTMAAPTKAVLDTAPFGPTLRRVIDFRQLAKNADVDRGPLAGAAVVATSYETTRSAVFHTGRAKPAPQDDDPVDYVETELTDVHVLASSAIQALFPAINIPSTDGRDRWYGDGGAHLNSPLAPALALGARKVIAIGLNSGVTPTDVEAGEPDFLDGAALLMQAALADQLGRDVATLARTNGAREAIPYIFVAPKDRFTIGRAARDVYTSTYAGIRGFRRDPDISVLGRAADAGRNLIHAELFSYLFMAKEFVARLLAMGRADATAWLSTHDTDLWQT